MVSVLLIILRLGRLKSDIGILFPAYKHTNVLQWYKDWIWALIGLLD